MSMNNFNRKWKLENVCRKWKPEIVGGNRNLKVLTENEIQQKLKLFVLKSFLENKLMLACEVEIGKENGHFAFSS